MNTKFLFKYQLRDYRNPLIIMYLCVYLLVIFIANAKVTSPYYFFNVAEGQIMWGLEIFTLITLFILALNSYKSYFKLSALNGVSRKKFFYSVTAGMGIISAIAALIDTFNSWFLAFFMPYYSMYQQFHHSNIFALRLMDVADSHGAFISDESFFSVLGAVVKTHFESAYTWPMLIQQVFFNVFVYFWIMMIGFLIAVLCYRIGKGLKIAISVGAPVLIFIIFIILDQCLGNDAVTYVYYNSLSYVFGGPDKSNYYLGMLNIFILSGITTVSAWWMIRRANVKNES